MHGGIAVSPYTMATALHAQIRCAQNIAFLHLLGEIQKPPHRNPVPNDRREANPGRTLPLSAEMDLTKTLAFLSSVEDDSNQVTAVCVVETGDGENRESGSQGLDVLVAANAKDPAVTVYLERIKRAFDDIFVILRRALKTSRLALEQAIFRSIVAACRKRILTRLRLECEGKKPSIKDHLKLICDASHRLVGNERRQRAQAFRSAAGQVIQRTNDHLKRASSSSGNSDDLYETLILLLEAISNLASMPGLSQFLASDLSTLMVKINPNVSEAIQNTIDKVLQYKHSAFRLAKLARKYAVIRGATTVLIRPDEAAFIFPSYDQPAGENILTGIFKRMNIPTGKKRRIDINSLCQRLKLSTHTASAQISSQVRKTLEESKIHAEMQLIWHLERHNIAPGPRVLGSNKEACFLCDAFISFQGQYLMPGCHGRLYPGWRLPSSDLDLVQRFNIYLEGLSRQRVQSIMSSGVKRLNHPLESRVFSPMNSVSSMPTQLSATPDGSESGDSDVTVTPDTYAETQNADHNTLRAQNAVVEDGNIQISAPDTTLHSSDQLSWKVVVPGQTECILKTRKLHLYVEYASSLVESRNSLSLRVHRVDSAGEEKRCIDSIIMEDTYDLGTDLPAGKEVCCSEGCRFINIKLGQHIYRIELDNPR